MDGGREEEDALDGVGREAGGSGGVDEIHCFAGLQWLFGGRLFLQFELVVYWHSGFERVVKFNLSERMARSFHASML